MSSRSGLLSITSKKNLVWFDELYDHKQMKTFALPFIFFISANYALGASFDCKSWSWQRDYKEEVKKDADYATSIDKFFEKSFQTHGLSAEKISHQCNSINSNRYSPPSIQSISTSKKCVSTKGIVGLEALPCFHYQVIPARKKSKGTVIRFQGGPGDILQFSRFQLDDYSIIAFNDIGVGDNSFPIDTRIKWQVFGDANQALILERILKEENVDNYVLYGGSYGSVTATMLGKKLSSGKRPPKAVLLVGVIADAPKIKPIRTIHRRHR